MKKSPLAEVKERFGSKEKLVKEMQTMFDKSDLFTDRLNEEKGLDHVSNAKLLKLYDTAAEVKERFSTRKKMTDEIVKVVGREKDAAYRASFDAWALPRLWDFYKSVAK